MAKAISAEDLATFQKDLAETPASVSYTHLTLPTTSRV